MSRPTILLCGSWDDGDGYPRAACLRGALRAAGFAVAECRVPAPFTGRRKQRLLAAPWRWPVLAARLAALRGRTRRELGRAVGEHAPAAVLVPYPGHLSAPWMRGVFPGPIVLDLFLSAYDTAVVDRGLSARGAPAARLLRALDRRACAAADVVLLDTAPHAARVADLLGVDARRLDWVPIGDPGAPATPPAFVPPAAGRPLELLFFGTGVPLHGLHFLIEAVRRVEGVTLTLVGGDDRDRERARRVLGGRLRLGAAFEPRAALDERLRSCHLVAGVFGGGAKAAVVVPHKAVLGLAAGRPVLTADTPGVRSLLEVGRDCEACAPADSAAIAGVLRRLRDDPGRLAALAAAARPAYDREFGPERRARRLAAVLGRLGLEAPAAGGARLGTRLTAAAGSGR